MMINRAQGARKACTPLTAGLVALAVLLTFGTASAEADDGVNLVRVEEDWELVVQEPDDETQSPQITCVTSPVGHIDGLFAALTLNHKTLPDYSAGGMQLQIWNGETPVTSSKFPHDELLSDNTETIRWTQQMRLSGGQLTFEVLDGTSTTWGNFGGQGTWRVSVATDLSNLNSYGPQISKTNSGVGYAGNRVTSLILKRVRGYSASELVVEDTTAKIVYQHE